MKQSLKKSIGSSRCSSLTQTDALTKLLIEKGVINEAEFMQKLSAERAGYQAMFQRAKQ